MKLRALVIFLFIVVATIPVYYLVKYVERKVKPRESFGGLILYLIFASFIIFLFVVAIILLLTYLVIPVLRELFGGASG